LRVTSTEQKGDVQVQRIVDGLFDRMKVAWGPQQPKPISEEQSKPKLAPKPKPKPRKRSAPEGNYALARVSQAEISEIIKKEVPQALRGELVTVMRTEIMKAVRGEIVRVVREEFDALGQMMKKTLERLYAIESRMAKIEGTVDKEVKLTFPEGMVKIDSPITIPEREVKVAAPVNVQPPSVTFDEGAISVHFNKAGGGKKEVRFERDPHDNCVKSAEIIDVSTGK
jgi:BMFP domain-containing protein YqiC